MANYGENESDCVKTGTLVVRKEDTKDVDYATELSYTVVSISLVSI